MEAGPEAVLGMAGGTDQEEPTRVALLLTSQARCSHVAGAAGSLYSLMVRAMVMRGWRVEGRVDGEGKACSETRSGGQH